MLLLVLTHLFHSFLGNIPFIPSFPYRFFQHTLPEKKRDAPWWPLKSQVGKWIEWGRILLNVTSEDHLFGLHGRGTFSFGFQLIYLWIIRSVGTWVVCVCVFSFPSIFDPLLPATKHYTELPFPGTLNVNSDYTNKY